MKDGWNESAARDPLASLHNTEAEQGLLGAILVNNSAYEHVADLVRPDDFGNAVHGRLYETIGKLLAQGTVADAVTLMRATGNSVGPNYVVQLIEGAVTVVNARHYAQTIADLAKRRDIVLAAQDTIADAVVVDPDRQADIVLDAAEERLFCLGERRSVNTGPVPLGTVLHETLDKIAAAHKAGGAITVDTGLVDLDRIISGMGAGDLCVLAGRPAMGKSALAGTIALNVARAGKRVAIFSLEMTREEITQRWISSVSGISTDQQRHGKLNQVEWSSLVDAGNYLSGLPIVVDDQPRLSVPQMRQRARRLRRRFGLDLIIIDHLQLIRQGGKQESRRLEIGDATSMLKAVAKELRVPVVLLSQLNRAVEHRDNKRPVLADLKESGDIEQDADLVMFLFREEYYIAREEPRHKPGQTREAFMTAFAEFQDKRDEVKGIAEVEVAKNRHGRTGMAKVHFDAERQRFDNLERAW